MLTWYFQSQCLHNETHVALKCIVLLCDAVSYHIDEQCSSIHMYRNLKVAGADATVTAWLSGGMPSWRSNDDWLFSIDSFASCQYVIGYSAIAFTSVFQEPVINRPIILGQLRINTICPCYLPFQTPSWRLFGCYTEQHRSFFDTKQYWLFATRNR